MVLQVKQLTKKQKRLYKFLKDLTVVVLKMLIV